MLSVNINGNLSKLEDKTCLAYLNSFDVITLLEVKCSYVFSVPGFEVLRSRNCGMRGGVAVLVKVYLWPSVFDAQSLNDQVFRLVQTVIYVRCPYRRVLYSAS